MAVPLESLGPDEVARNEEAAGPSGDESKNRDEPARAEPGPGEPPRPANPGPILANVGYGVADPQPGPANAEGGRAGFGAGPANAARPPYHPLEGPCPYNGQILGPEGILIDSPFRPISNESFCVERVAVPIRVLRPEFGGLRFSESETVQVLRCEFNRPDYGLPEVVFIFQHEVPPRYIQLVHCACTEACNDTRWLQELECGCMVPMAQATFPALEPCVPYNGPFPCDCDCRLPPLIAASPELIGVPNNVYPILAEESHFGRVRHFQAPANAAGNAAQEQNNDIAPIVEPRPDRAEDVNAPREGPARVPALAEQVRAQAEAERDDSPWFANYITGRKHDSRHNPPGTGPSI